MNLFTYPKGIISEQVDKENEGELANWEFCVFVFQIKIKHPRLPILKIFAFFQYTSTVYLFNYVH